jgi:hypothetical protein
LLGRNLSNGLSEANIVWGQGISSNQFLGIGKWTGSAYTEQMRLDSSGNLGLGVTPSATSGSYKNVQNGRAVMMGASNDTGAYWNANATYDSVWKYIATGAATRYEQGAFHSWYTAPSGTAGANLTFTQAMTLDASSNLIVGGTSPYATITSYASASRSGGLGIRNSAGTAAGGIYTGAAGSGGGSTDIYVEGVGFLGFITGAGGSERARISSSGNLLLGTTLDFSKFASYGSNTVLDSFGQIAAITSNNFGADIGGQVMMGGKYRNIGGVSDFCAFGGIAGRKENGTDGNYAGYLQFLVSNNPSGNIERGRINSSGQFLLGVASTQGSQRLTSAGDIALQTVVGSPGDAFPSLLFYNNNSSGFINAGITATVGTTINSGNILFNTNNSGTYAERARIDQAGNFGIGRTNPVARLDVGADGTGEGLIAQFTRFTTGPGIHGLYISANVTDPYVKLAATGSSAGGFRFDCGASERMRLTPTGEFLVGTTSNPSNQRMRVVGGAAALEVSDTTLVTNATGYFGFQVRGDIGAVNLSRSTGNAIAFFNSANASGLDGTAVGIISITTTATTYATSSDYRLKNTIAPMTGALAKVALLKPCTYKWNADGSDGEGFIAHELAEVVPQCVTGQKDAVDAEGKPQYQGIDTSFLVATLTAAIQEQQALINSLKARLDAANL